MEPRTESSRTESSGTESSLAERSCAIEAPNGAERSAAERSAVERSAVERSAVERYAAAERSAPAPARMPVRSAIARAYRACSRWTFVPESPRIEGPRILIGAPHTSNWDFVLMLAIAWGEGLDPRWLGKHELFRGPFGGVMRRLGGIPVDRRDPSGVVDAVVARIRGGERIALVVTPDGTRTNERGWRSGFYRIAMATGLPVTLGFVDRTTMTTGLGPTLRLTGDVFADMERIRGFYTDKAGLRPERRAEPRLASEPREFSPR